MNVIIGIARPAAGHHTERLSLGGAALELRKGGYSWSAVVRCLGLPDERRARSLAAEYLLASRGARS